MKKRKIIPVRKHEDREQCNSMIRTMGEDWA